MGSKETETHVCVEIVDCSTLFFVYTYLPTNIHSALSGCTTKTRMHSSRMCTDYSSSHLLGGVCVSACWDTPPGPGLETPRVWTWTPPPTTPNLPLGAGLDTPPSVGLDSTTIPGRPPTPPPLAWTQTQNHRHV